MIDIILIIFPYLYKLFTSILSLNFFSFFIDYIKDKIPFIKNIINIEYSTVSDVFFILLIVVYLFNSIIAILIITKKINKNFSFIIISIILISFGISFLTYFLYKIFKTNFSDNNKDPYELNFISICIFAIIAGLYNLSTLEYSKKYKNLFYIMTPLLIIFYLTIILLYKANDLKNILTQINFSDIFVLFYSIIIIYII